jgi:transposase
MSHKKINQEKKDEHFNGSYYIRSSRTDLSEAELWDLYTTLTNIESTFRVLKSDLNLRPIFHQNEDRSDAHIFVTLLAYRILNSIQTRLRSNGIHSNWAMLREDLEMQIRITTSFDARDGSKIYKRSTSLDKELYGDIYKALGLKMKPLKAKTLKNVELKTETISRTETIIL